MNIIEEIAQGKAQLLDVRRDDEWTAGHARGAIHIVLDRLLGGDTAGLTPDLPIYVYCAGGVRAGAAESYLKSRGFQATNIGGLTNWEILGGAVEV